jgi:hypothetical protein
MNNTAMPFVLVLLNLHGERTVAKAFGNKTRKFQRKYGLKSWHHLKPKRIDIIIWID